jgi:phosphoglycolate phosphatase
LLRTVLFDLDGTLVDTAPDLGYCLNTMLQRRGMSYLPAEAIRAQASHGSQGLIRLGFGVGQEAPEFPALRREFLALYTDHLAVNSRLFPGMSDMLQALETQDITCGVVTNKPTRFTLPLLEHFGLLDRMACVVSGDTCGHSKPHPEPMLYACSVAGRQTEECLYVGDAQRDVEAAKAAGMPSLVALYGYLADTDRPMEWGADGFICRPMDLLDYVGLYG